MRFIGLRVQKQETRDQTKRSFARYLGSSGFWYLVSGFSKSIRLFGDGQAEILKIDAGGGGGFGKEAGLGHAGNGVDLEHVRTAVLVEQDIDSRIDLDAKRAQDYIPELEALREECARIAKSLEIAPSIVAPRAALEAIDRKSVV